MKWLRLNEGDPFQHKKKKHRVEAVEFWIEVARECVNIGNFNSMMGIITGLNMFPVARLKKTWTKIQSGKFAVLEHQMDPRYPNPVFIRGYE